MTHKMKYHAICWFTALFAIVPATIGCGEKKDVDSQTCSPGAVEECSCDSGGTGVKTCSPGGVWGACENCSQKCTPECEDLECGPDPVCGESCGVCEGDRVCEDGRCVPRCIPECGDLECGIDPVCGESCGACEGDRVCEDGRCVPRCIPECGDLECGIDPVCGESCGACETGYDCVQGQCLSVCGEVLYITNEGSGDRSGRSFEDSMSIIDHNSRTFNPGDTIYLAEKITVPHSLTPPSNGTAECLITYRGDHPEHPGSLEQPILGSEPVWRMLDIRNRQHIDIKNIDFRSNVGAEDDISNRAAIWIEEYYEPTGHIRISGCTFFQTVAGILIRGDTQYVKITGSHFANMVNSGVATFNYYGRNDSDMPSFIIVGGAPEDGNTFVNIGRLNNPSPGAVPGQVLGTQARDVVFSYNHVYADEPGWGTGIYLNGVERVLVEHNYIHDIDSTHRRSAINFKSDRDWLNRDIVIRFNKVGPLHGERAYTADSGIRIGQCLENAIVYGNMVHDIEGFGIFVGWGWAEGSDACRPENVYVYSNIVSNTHRSGIYLAGTWQSKRYLKNIHVTNNLFYRTVSPYDSDLWFNYAIHADVAGDSFYRDIHILNNIVDTTRDGSADYIGIRARYKDDVFVNFNHHYFPGAIPAVFYENSTCKPCAWNGSEVPGNYGDNDSEGDPLYSDAATQIFSLAANSPCIGSGTELTSQIPSLTIHGEQYDFSLSTGLDPNTTDWSVTPPIVHTLDRNDHGAGWDKGPYVYVER